MAVNFERIETLAKHVIVDLGGKGEDINDLSPEDLNNVFVNLHSIIYLLSNDFRDAFWKIDNLYGSELELTYIEPYDPSEGNPPYYDDFGDKEYLSITAMLEDYGIITKMQDNVAYILDANAQTDDDMKEIYGYGGNEYITKEGTVYFEGVLPAREMHAFLQNEDADKLFEGKEELRGSIPKNPHRHAYNILGFLGRKVVTRYTK